MKGRKKEGEGEEKGGEERNEQKEGRKHGARERERESVLAKETWKREDKEEGRRARITPRRVVATPF